MHTPIKNDFSIWSVYERNVLDIGGGAISFRPVKLLLEWVGRFIQRELVQIPFWSRVFSE